MLLVFSIFYGQNQSNVQKKVKCLNKKVRVNYILPELAGVSEALQPQDS